jgi:hypothetical protein
LAASANFQNVPDQRRRTLRPLPIALACALVGLAAAAQETPTVAPTGDLDPALPPPEPIPVVYVDQYLVDDTSPADAGYDAFGRGPEPFGRRYVEIEAGYYTAEDDLLGDDLEQGLGFRFGRETLNWGTIDLDASLADVESDYLSREAQGSFGSLTLRHSSMPVSDTGLLFSTLGDQRTPANSLLQSSYRLRLPTSMLRGVSAELRNNGNGLHLSSGNTGENRGIRLPRFEATGGRLTSLGLDRTIGERFMFGAEMTDLSDDDDIRDHRSLLIGAGFAPAARPQEHSARLMRDDDGNLALWSDSRHRLGTATNLRYGLFHFAPDIVWADLPIQSDQQGLYLQADAGNARFSLSGGYDFLDYGLEAAPTSSFEKHTFYFNGSLQARRSVVLGLNSSFADLTYSGLFGDQQTITRLNLFTSIRRDIGGLRLDVFFDELASTIDANRREREGAAASLDWNMRERVRLTTELRAERNLDLRGETRRTEFSTLMRYDLFDAVSFGLQASFYQTDGDLYAENSGVGLNADATWSILRRWTGTASIYRNQSEIVRNDFLPGPPDGVAGTDFFWLSVRYRQTSGQPFAQVGRRDDGTSGSGVLSGQVFFDENRDGIRQPSEEAAVGVTVLLDGRYQTRTDPSGFYTFLPVPTGEHEVIVLVEELPLPWGLDDDTPRRTRVSYRSTVMVNFPLTVMD